MMHLKGTAGSSVTFDGAQVVISKRYPRSSVAIPLHSIGAVEILTAGLGGKALRFAQAGGTIQRQGIFSAPPIMRDDPYTLIIVRSKVKEAEAFRNAVFAAQARMTSASPVWGVTTQQA